MTDNHKHKFAAVILAAGKGTRMKSDLPKVMHKFAGKAMINHVVGTAASCQPEKIVLVLAPGMEMVRDSAKQEFANCELAIQDKQLGTGHAVRCATDMLKNYNGDILVLYGDTPLIRPETLHLLLNEKVKHGAAISLLAIKPQDPTGYGRLVMKKEPYVERIVECKDANSEEKEILYGWGGVMAFDGAFLRDALAKLEPSPVTKEYYLTSLIEMASEQHLKTVMVTMEMEEAMGVNSRLQLAEAEHALQTRLRKQALENGVTLIDPTTVYFASDTKIAQDVIIHPHVVFGEGVSIETGAEIKSFSHIEGAHIGKNATVGPFARLRPGSVLEEEAHVGNFVELKKTRLGKGAKANHLSYVGDADVGANANIGAGTITCNYDGINKYQTTIGEGAFIGSNTSLVAPVTVGKGAIVGAGSVITKDVEADSLTLERSEQVTISGKAKEIRQKKQKK